MVDVSAADEFERVIKAEYAKATGRVPEVYVCAAADGAERVQ